MRLCVLATMLVACGQPAYRPSPPAPLPRYEPATECEREVVAQAEAVHAKLSELVYEVATDVRRDQPLDAETRTRRAAVIVDVTLDAPMMHVMEYRAHFRGLLDAKHQLAVAAKERDAWQAVLEHARFVDDHFTELLMSRPLYWAQRCHAAGTAPTPTPMPARDAELVSWFGAAQTRSKQCRNLAADVRARPQAERVVALERLASCEHDMKVHWYRCMRELAPRMASKHDELLELSWIPARLLELYRHGSATPQSDEIAAVTTRVATALDHLPPLLAELPLATEARRSLETHDPRRIQAALANLHSPCSVIELAEEPTCVIDPEACRVRYELGTRG